MKGTTRPEAARYVCFRIPPRTGTKGRCIWFFSWVLLLALFACSCVPERFAAQELKRTKRPMMGTLVEVVWRTKGANDQAEAVRGALDRMETLASRMSLYNPGSELARINEAAGRTAVSVSDEVLDVIEKSLALSRATEGAFDITVGPVEAAWGDIQREGGGKVPAEPEIRDALGRVGYRHVKTDPEARTVFLEKEGMRIDLGGIAKGYIVDQGMAWLHEAGIQAALINAGGDILVSGGPDSPSWRIGLQDPLEQGALLGVFLVRKAAVVTSGSYERYLETEEGRFTHILNPETGRPVEGLLSVTVVAEQAFAADALATALMVKGREDGISLLRRFPSTRGVLVERDGTIWVEEGLRDLLQLDPLPSRYTLRFYPPAQPGGE